MPPPSSSPTTITATAGGAGAPLSLPRRSLSETSQPSRRSSFGAAVMRKKRIPGVSATGLPTSRSSRSRFSFESAAIADSNSPCCCAQLSRLCDTSTSRSVDAHTCSSSQFDAIWLRCRCSTCSCGSPSSGGTATSLFPERSSSCSRGSRSTRPAPTCSELDAADSVRSAEKRLSGASDVSSFDVRITSRGAPSRTSFTNAIERSLKVGPEKSA